MKHTSILTYRFKDTSEVHTIRFSNIFEWGGSMIDLNTKLEDKHGSFYHPTALDYAVISKEVTS